MNLGEYLMSYGLNPIEWAVVATKKGYYLCINKEDPWFQLELAIQ